ncbi:15890_t:CDS:1, partial [Cetraspora pellucida]
MVSKKSEVITKTPEVQIELLVSNKYNIYIDKKELKKEKKESNEVKSDNDNNSSNFEKEILNESD